MFVGGVRYEVAADSVVALEGAAEVRGDDRDLRIGMKVRIEADQDGNGNRVARRIDYDDDLTGPVGNVQIDPDTGLGSFTALGVTVIVDAATVFDDDVGDHNNDGRIDLADLDRPGERLVVEVSGLHSADGLIATRIDREDDRDADPNVDEDEYELKGFVEAVAADGSSITVSGVDFLIVSGAGGTELDDGVEINASLIGRFVEVEADEDAMGALVAVEVELEDDIGDQDGDGDRDDDDRFGDIEIEGVLIAIDTSVAPNQIVINGTTLAVNDASAFSGLVGRRIKIEGEFNADGVLLLDELELESEQNVRTEDRVASTDVNAVTITTRLGVVIEPTGQSRVEDDIADSDDGDHLTPAEFVSRVQPGDFIEARGVPLADGSVAWQRVERDDEDDQECELRGPVQSISGSASDFSFDIMGVTVDTSQVAADEFDDLGRDAFFAALTVGAVVEAKSDAAGAGCEAGRLTAREVEFEDDDGIAGTADDNDDDDDERGDDGIDNELTGTPTNVGATQFDLNGTTVSVNDATLIDDSIVERALGQEIDDDVPFAQLPGNLTLSDLLTGEFAIEVAVDAAGIAIRIEDI